MDYAANEITVRGSLCELPQFSHENHGKRFFRFTLEVPRLSGVVDLLPVVAWEDCLNRMDLSGGTRITVRGQVRSFNNHGGSGQKLLIFIFASQLETADLPAVNEVHLRGTICKPPVYRRTPLGREICDVMLAVPRAYHRSDYLPCILWGRTAQEIARCGVGDAIVISGRLQSRQYRKVTPQGEELRTAYEISALTAEAT